MNLDISDNLWGPSTLNKYKETIGENTSQVLSQFNANHVKCLLKADWLITVMFLK